MRMRIAVTCMGRTLDSPVDPRFGRAAGFIIWETESKEFQAVDNSANLNASEGAGIQAAQALAGMKPDVVLTGHCGPRAFRALRAAGIQVVTGAQGTVATVLEDFSSGRLKPSESPDVEGHR
jgi:predicted Fe-Mo cluster-binding NifX family protein